MVSLFTKEKTSLPEKNGVSVMGSAHHLGDERSLFYAAMGHRELSERNRFIFPRTAVSIAMNIRFDCRCVNIGTDYYSDLAKMASLLKENTSLIAILEAYDSQGFSTVPVEISKMRLRNVMNYLVDNFSIPRSKFYVDKLVGASSHEFPAATASGWGGVSVILKYPSVYS